VSTKTAAVCTRRPQPRDRHAVRTTSRVQYSSAKPTNRVAANQRDVAGVCHRPIPPTCATRASAHGFSRTASSSLSARRRQPQKPNRPRASLSSQRSRHRRKLGRWYPRNSILRRRSECAGTCAGWRHFRQLEKCGCQYKSYRMLQNRRQPAACPSWSCRHYAVPTTTTTTTTSMTITITRCLQMMHNLQRMFGSPDYSSTILHRDVADSTFAGFWIFYSIYCVSQSDWRCFRGCAISSRCTGEWHFLHTISLPYIRYSLPYITYILPEYDKRTFYSNFV